MKEKYPKEPVYKNDEDYHDDNSVEIDHGSKEFNINQVLPDYFDVCPNVKKEIETESDYEIVDLNSPQKNDKNYSKNIPIINLLENEEEGNSIKIKNNLLDTNENEFIGRKSVFIRPSKNKEIPKKEIDKNTNIKETNSNNSYSLLDNNNNSTHKTISESESKNTNYQNLTNSFIMNDIKINDTKNEFDNNSIFRSESISRKSSIKKEDYLTTSDFKYFTKTNPNNTTIDILYNRINKIEENFTSEKNLKSLIDLFSTNFFNEKHILPKVGIMQNFNNYMRSKNIKVFKDLNYNKELFQIFKTRFNLFRNIGGDGNCFYRAIIFNYLENIIYQNNLILLIIFIFDIEDTIKNKNFENLFSFNKIKKENSLKGLVYLYKILSKNFEFNFIKAKNPNENYNNFNLSPLMFLVFLFNFDKDFDYGLIMYIRIKIKNFIEENKNKLYSNDFSVRLGDLLPERYIQDEDKYDWDLFYDNNLLKFYSEAENIIIYVIPYILKFDLNIYTYDIGNNIEEKTREIKCGLKDKINISVFYKKMHYEVIYSKDFYVKYSRKIEKEYNDIMNLFDYKGFVLDNKKGDFFNKNNSPQLNLNFLSNGNNNNINLSKDKEKEINEGEFNINYIHNNDSIMTRESFYIDKDEKNNTDKDSENTFYISNINKNNDSLNSSIFFGLDSNNNSNNKNNISTNQQINILNKYQEKQMHNNPNNFHCDICKQIKTLFSNLNLNSNSNIEKLNLNFYTQKDNNFIICRECFKNEFISLLESNLLQIFYENINKFRGTDKYSFIIDIKKINKNCQFDTYESNVKDLINKIPFKINEKIEQIYFQEIKPFINKNELELFNNSKMSVCFFCNKSNININSKILNTKNNKNLLPCKCYYCSIDCLFNYFKLYFKKKNNFKDFDYNYYCICGYKYKIRQLLNLFDLLITEYSENKTKEISPMYEFAIENLKKLTKNKFEFFCMKCEKNISSDNINDRKKITKLTIINFDNFNIYKKLKLKDFDHYLCFNCLYKQIQGYYEDENILELAQSARYVENYFKKNNKLDCLICEDIHEVKIR